MHLSLLIVFLVAVLLRLGSVAVSYGMKKS